MDQQQQQLNTILFFQQAARAGSAGPRVSMAFPRTACDVAACMLVSLVPLEFRHLLVCPEFVHVFLHEFVADCARHMRREGVLAAAAHAHAAQDYSPSSVPTTALTATTIATTCQPYVGLAPSLDALLVHAHAPHGAAAAAGRPGRRVSFGETAAGAHLEPVTTTKSSESAAHAHAHAPPLSRQTATYTDYTEFDRLVLAAALSPARSSSSLSSRSLPPPLSSGAAGSPLSGATLSARAASGADGVATSDIVLTPLQLSPHAEANGDAAAAAAAQFALPPPPAQSPTPLVVSPRGLARRLKITYSTFRPHTTWADVLTARDFYLHKQRYRLRIGGGEGFDARVLLLVKCRLQSRLLTGNRATSDEWTDCLEVNNRLHNKAPKPALVVSAPVAARTRDAAVAPSSVEFTMSLHASSHQEGCEFKLQFFLPASAFGDDNDDEEEEEEAYVLIAESQPFVTRKKQSEPSGSGKKRGRAASASAAASKIKKRNKKTRRDDTSSDEDDDSGDSEDGAEPEERPSAAKRSRR